MLGFPGLLLAAGAACAQVPKEVTLFGQKYRVTVQSRGCTFKNGVKITLQTPGDGVDTRQKANLSFVEGSDRSADRLFVVAPIGTDADGPTGDQFYMLKGTDADGLFTTTSSEATQYFGGKVDRNRGGRGQTVAWLSDTNTGVKKDRNIAVLTFTGPDRVQFYDLDTLGGNFEDDAVLTIDLGGDDNMPAGSWVAFTRAPNGSMVTVGSSGSFEMGVMDPTKDQFFNVKTDLVEATKSNAIKIDPPDATVHGLARFGENEYWILASQNNPGGDNDSTDEQYLYRLEVTLPTDFSKAAPGSIKAEVMGREELISKKLHGSPGGMFGVAVGRETTAGKRTIYFTDWVGNMITLTPMP